MPENKKCPHSKCMWLLIPIIITAISGWILKGAGSIFSADPLSVWFSLVLSFFVGVWISVGLKRVTCDKNHLPNNK